MMESICVLGDRPPSPIRKKGGAGGQAQLITLVYLQSAVKLYKTALCSPSFPIPSGAVPAPPLFPAE